MIVFDKSSTTLMGICHHVLYNISECFQNEIFSQYNDVQIILTSNTFK